MDINKYSPSAAAEVLWGNYIKITIYRLNLVPSFYINVLSAEYSSVFGDVDVEDRTLNVGVDFYCITQPQPRAASRARNEGSLRFHNHREGPQQSG